MNHDEGADHFVNPPIPQIPYWLLKELRWKRQVLKAMKDGKSINQISTLVRIPENIVYELQGTRPWHNFTDKFVEAIIDEDWAQPLAPRRSH